MQVCKCFEVIASRCKAFRGFGLSFLDKGSANSRLVVRLLRPFNVLKKNFFVLNV